jgi:hypothetical protein
MDHFKIVDNYHFTLSSKLCTYDLELKREVIMCAAEHRTFPYLKRKVEESVDVEEYEIRCTCVKGQWIHFLT